MEIPILSGRRRQREAAHKEIEDRAIAKAMEAVSAAIVADPELSKSFLGGNAAVSAARMPGTSWSNQGGLSNKLIARVTANLSQSFGRPPEQLEAAMAQQGLSWGPPFPPGRPLDPFWGYRRPPRTWDYPVGANVQVTPRSGRVSFDTLKSLWNAYDVAQICTRHLINDVRSLDYHFEAAIGVRDDVSEDIRKARVFFDSPDKRQPFRAWLAEYLMDAIRYDAGVLYVRRNQVGDPIALEVVNGTTIIPNIDFYGRIATDENDDDPQLSAAGTFRGEVTPAFTQVIEGMPWDWLAADDIIYQPVNPMPDSQYGLAPLEAVLLTANTDLRFQWHFLNYFTAGTIPQGFMKAPPDLSDPNQIAQWQEAWDALMLGDQQKLRQIRWVPAGAEYTPVGPATDKFDAEFPLYLMRRTTAAHGITPADLGFTDTVNKATSETQVDVQFRVGTLPLIRHVEDVINLFTSEHLKLRVRLRFDTGREIEDRLNTAHAEKIYIDAGVISPDEPRARLGYPVSLTRPTPRFVNNTRSGPIPLIALESLAGKLDPETFAPARDADFIDHPFVEVPGVMPVIGSKAYSDAQNTTSAMQANMIARGAGKPPPHPDDETTSPVSHLSRKPVSPMAKSAPFKAAGLAVVAQDSGRALMIQRSNLASGKSAGRWEFPGGRLDDVEGLWEAARREWEEETGNQLPGKGRVVATWENDEGPYRLFVYLIGHEADVNLNPHRGDMQVTDPDHPNAGQTEVMAWWSPEDAADAGKALRRELRDFDWDLLRQAAQEEVSKDGAVGTGGPSAAGGITSITGMHGSDLRCDEDDEDDEEAEKAEAVALALRRWKENSRNRLRKGLAPRRFVDPDLPADLAEQIWAELGSAATRDAIDRAFLGKAPARSEPGHAAAEEEAVREALQQVIAAGVQRAAIRAAFSAVREVRKSTDQSQKARAHRAVLAVFLGADLVIERLIEALLALWRASGRAGAGQAASHLGLEDAAVPPTGRHADLGAAVDLIARGLANALMYQVAEEVSTAVASGATLAEVEATATQAARRRARLDARVEARKSLIAALMDVYQVSGVERVAWVGGECHRCRVNAAASPISIRDVWPDGPPPVHPSCQCSIVPVRS